MGGDAAGPITVDVALIGGGMVGASLALALLDTGIRVLLVEGTAPGSNLQPSFDERTTALGNASRRIFQALGVWPHIAPEAAAIRTIHVSEAGRFGFARLRAQEQGIEAFGYVVANRVIGAALWRKLQAGAVGSTRADTGPGAGGRAASVGPVGSGAVGSATAGLIVRVPARPEGVEITSEGVRFEVVSDAGTRERVAAKLVVAADGAHSSIRTAAGIGADVEDYDQVAIVANVAADRPQDGTAYERFTPSGPLAVLPLHDGSYGVIWSARPERATELLAFDDQRYLQELQDRFGWRAGRFVRVGRRASYPLKLTRAVTTVGTRTVLIGNAAQALHPVAGQGFNLGLRDAAMLAEVVANAQGDVGSPELLRQFSQWRARDRSGVVRFTDGLIKLFGDTRPGFGVLRNLGLLMFDVAPPAKSALARVSAGFGGPTPRLARGLGVRERPVHGH